MANKKETDIDIFVLVETSKLAEKIQAILDKKFYNRPYLARISGVSINTIHNLLNGRNPTFATLLCVTKALDVQLYTLLIDSKSNEKLNNIT